VEADATPHGSGVNATPQELKSIDAFQRINKSRDGNI